MLMLAMCNHPEFALVSFQGGAFYMKAGTLIAAALAALTLPACAQTSEETCRREASRLRQSCEGPTAVRQCWQERLSPRCFKEADRAAGATSASCKKELARVAEPCQAASASYSKRCVEENLSQPCRDTMAKTEQARQACDEAVQRVWQLCKAEPQAKQAQCFEKNRPAANAACQ
jgi:hypothetical protein